jgi:hypothetical protein
MSVRAGTALLAAALLAACGEESNIPSGVDPTEEFGRMRVVHAVADPANADRVNVVVEGVPFAVNMAYATAAPAAPTLYYPIYEGSREVLVQRTADTTVHVLEATLDITADADQTLFAVTVGGAVDAIVTTDDNTPASGDTPVKLRIIHFAGALAGDLDVYVTAPGADISAIAPTVAALAPWGVSPYLQVAAGTHQVRFTEAGTKTVVATATTPALAAGAIRTILALTDQAGTTLTTAILTDR